jgi:hypothetical protein
MPHAAASTAEPSDQIQGARTSKKTKEPSAAMCGTHSTHSGGLPRCRICSAARPSSSTWVRVAPSVSPSAAVQRIPIPSSRERVAGGRRCIAASARAQRGAAFATARSCNADTALQHSVATARRCNSASLQRSRHSATGARRESQSRKNAEVGSHTCAAAYSNAVDARAVSGCTGANEGLYTLIAAAAG